MRNTLYLAVSPLLRTALSLPLAGFVAHQLGVDGYGRFNFALSFAVLLSVTANLGLNETFLRRAATDPPDLPQLWSSVLAGKGVLLAVYLTVLGVSATVLGHDHDLVVLVLVMGLYQAAQSFENTSFAVFCARQDMKGVAWIGAISVVAELPLTVLVLLAGGRVLALGVSRVVLTAAGGIAATVAVRRCLHVPLGRPSLGQVRPLVVPGLSFAMIAALFCVNYRAGVLVLERIHGVSAVAMFSAAMVPTERLFMLLPSLQNALFPFFSSMGTEDEPRFASSLARAIRYMSLLATGLGVGVSLVGPWALRLVFPRSFNAVGPVLEVLAVAVAFRALSGLLATALLARGCERTVVRATALQCTVNIGSAVLLVGPFGAVGLAWAFGISEAAVLVDLVIVLWRRGSLGAAGLAQFAVPAACGLAVFVGFAVLPNARESLVMPVAFAAAYPPLLVVAGALSREDLAYFGTALARHTGPRA